MSADEVKGFPKKLLDDTDEARLAHFINWRTKHPHLDSARTKALAALGGQNGPRVIIIAGPTGVGKTTMAKSIYEQLRATTPEERDAGTVPAMFVTAVAPEGTAFNWKDFYIRILQAAAEPLIEEKIEVPRQLSLFPGGHLESPLERVVPASLRRSVQQCFRHRQTRYLFVDEAYHMLMVSNPKRAHFPFEVIKSLAAESGLTIVLTGTYGLLDIRDQSGQLARRSEIIHFPRYDMRTKEGKSGFASALNSLAKQLPIENLPDLLEESESFYIMTGGAIGILKDCLVNALRSYLKTKGAVFNFEFVKKHAMSNRALKTIIEEALLGEEKLRDIPLSDLKTLLMSGLPKVQDTKPKPKAPRPAVGKPKAIRHEIGGAYG